MKKVIIILLILTSSLFLGFLGIGFFSPEKYSGKIEGKVNATPAAVWKYLTDFESLSSRRSEITRVEMLGKNRSGYPAWKEHTDMGGFLIFEVLDMQEPKNLVISMGKSTISMTGTWSYTLKQEGEATRIIIEENSRITNISIRTMMALSGRDWNLKEELRLMQEHFKKPAR